MIVDKLAIVGTGLIGGSFALALKQAGAVREVLGVGRNAARLTVARELGLIDGAADWAQAGQADCILLAMPVGDTEAVLRLLAPHLKAGAIVTDAGSTKANVVAAARAVLGAHFSDFIPGHPIAGSEQSGPGAARVDLYQGRKVVLTPQADTRSDAVATVTALWQAAGAQVEMLEPGLVPAQTITVECDNPDRELLLVDWLNTIVYEMATRKLLFSRYDVHLEGDHLTATLHGEPVDVQRYQPAVEVKGATYTELKVVQRAEGEWLAHCVVDV